MSCVVNSPGVNCELVLEIPQRVSSLVSKPIVVSGVSGKKYRYQLFKATVWHPTLLKHSYLWPIQLSTDDFAFDIHHNSDLLVWIIHCDPYESDVMPRSQPAARATALVCLVLWRSYVSNSASPAADWGLKVILQPPYRQRTSLAAAVPPTHRIAGRKSPSEGTFIVLALCLRGTFNVPSPCHRPRVRTTVCVSVPQWHCDGAGAFKAPLTCVAHTDISSLPRVYIAS